MMTYYDCIQLHYVVQFISKNQCAIEVVPRIVIECIVSKYMKIASLDPSFLFPIFKASNLLL